MSGSKEWNDLDGGGDQPPKQGARPDLQEKLRRRFRNREQALASPSRGNPDVEPQGAAASGHDSAFQQIAEQPGANGRLGGDVASRGTTPGLDDPDANGNFMFPEGKSQSPKVTRSKRSSTAAGKTRRPDPPDQFDLALTSVLGEIDSDEKAKQKGKKGLGEPNAVFQNNFDDIELQADQARFNIPASRQAVGQRGEGKQNAAIGGIGGQQFRQQGQAQGKNSMQDLFDSVMGGRGGDNRGGDPLAALLFGQGQGQGRNRGGDGMLNFHRLLGGREDRGRQDGNIGVGGLRRGQMNDNEPMPWLLGGGRDPLAALFGRGQDGDESRKRFQNDTNDVMTSLIGQGRGRGKNEDAMVDDDEDNGPVGVGGLRLFGDGRRNNLDDEDDVAGGKDGKQKKNAVDPVKAMLDELIKGNAGKSGLLASVQKAEKDPAAQRQAQGAAGSKLPDPAARRQAQAAAGSKLPDPAAQTQAQGAVGSKPRDPAAQRQAQGAAGSKLPPSSMPGDLNQGQDVEESLLLNWNLGSEGVELEGGENGEHGKEDDGQGQIGEAMAALMGHGKEGQNSMDDLMAMMGRGRGRGSGGQIDLGGGREGRGGGQDPLGGLMSSVVGGRGAGGQNPMVDMMSLMGERARAKGQNSSAGKKPAPSGGGGAGGRDPLARLVGGGGAGGRDPLAGLMGGGGAGGRDPLAGLVGGGGAGGRDPLAGLVVGGEAGGRDPLAGLISSLGHGGGGGSQNPMAAMMSSMMGGGGAGGRDPLAGLMSGGGAGGRDAMMSSMTMGGGRGRGSSGGLDPLAAMLGGAGAGGQNPMARMMTGFGNGRGGGQNPMAAMMSSMMGGGRGQSAGGLDPMAAMMGGGGADSMVAMQEVLLKACGGDPARLAQMLDKGDGNGPDEQLTRQLMASVGTDEEVNPDTADDNQIIQQLLAYEAMRVAGNRAPRANPAMHTILIVDTSSSMSGDALMQAGQFISQFLSGLEEIQFEYQLQENVALISCGAGIQVVQHFTSDYSLIRNGTNSLSPEGSSRFHMGLLIPLVMLSNGARDMGRDGEGDVLQMGIHAVCPRVIFISHGHITNTVDNPGQTPARDDQMTLALQSQCIELVNKMTESTLCKVYTVPVGNANERFLETLAETNGGRMLQPSDAKRMSRCLLHHTIVGKLRESGQKSPTAETIVALLKQITAASDPEDIKGVEEALGEGEPDLAGRDERMARDLMAAQQGRQGMMPDQGHQGLEDLYNFHGGMGGLLPGSGRMPTGGIRNVAGGMGGKPNLPGGGMPELLELPGGKGDMPGLGEVGQGQRELPGGMLELSSMIGRGRGESPGGMLDFSAMFGRGRGVSPGGMPDLSSMIGRGRGESPGGMPDFSSMFGRGRGESSGGMPDLNSMFGRGRGESPGSVPDLSSMIGRGRGESYGGMPEFSAMFGRGRGESPGGMPDLSSMFGRGRGESPAELLSDKPGSQGMEALRKEQSKPGGLQSRGGFGGNISGLGSEAGMNHLQQLFSESNLGNNGKEDQRRNENREDYIEISGGGGRRWLDGFRGLGRRRHGGMPEGLMAMMHDGDKGVGGDLPLLNPEGMGGEADAVRGRNQQSRFMMNIVPPSSFGVDEDGNPRSVDILEGAGDNEGDELMKQLAEMLGIDPNADPEEDEEIVRGQVNAGGLLGDLPELLGMQRGQGQGQNRNEPGLLNFFRDQQAQGNQGHEGNLDIDDVDESDDDVVMGGMG